MRRYDSLSAKQKKTIDKIVEKTIKELKPQILYHSFVAMFSSSINNPLFSPTPNIQKKAEEDFRDLFSYFADPNFLYAQ